MDIEVGQVYLTDDNFVDKLKNQPIKITKITKRHVTYKYLNIEGYNHTLSVDAFTRWCKPFPQYNTPLYKVLNS